MALFNKLKKVFGGKKHTVCAIVTPSNALSEEEVELIKKSMIKEKQELE